MIVRRSVAPVAAVLLSLLSLVWLAAGCVSIRVFDGSRRELVETVVAGDEGPKILLLEIDGVLRESTEDRGLFAPDRESSVARVREQLDRAREDSEVRALLLRVNSPGGTVTASDLIYREIVRFKQDRDVPVVAQLMGIAASGGYYVAMAADRVRAEPTTVTGSIGVLFLGVSFAGLMDKLGIEDQTLTAGEYKDAASPLRRMTPEERAQLQSVLDDLHARFQRVVARGRSELDEQRVAALSDGRVFSASQAEAQGLVDDIGGLDEAIAEAERLAGLHTSRVVTYHRPREWKQNVYSKSALPSALRLELVPWPEAIERPAFLYLWSPGS